SMGRKSPPVATRSRRGSERARLVAFLVDLTGGRDRYVHGSTALHAGAVPGIVAAFPHHLDRCEAGAFRAFFRLLGGGGIDHVAGLTSGLRRSEARRRDEGGSDDHAGG